MTTLKASQEIEAPPQRAADVILSPEGTKIWFGRVEALQADATWPSVGSHMRWTVQKGRTAFDAKVVENHLPESVTLEVRSPYARARVTHRFEGLPESRTRYVKIVDARWSTHRLLSPLIKWFVVGPATRREVRRAARLASGAARSRRRNA